MAVVTAHMSCLEYMAGSDIREKCSSLDSWAERFHLPTPSCSVGYKNAEDVGALDDCNLSHPKFDIFHMP